MKTGLLVALVVAVSALVYVQYGFNGALIRDNSIYVYSGQQMAEGVPPYVSIFDHKGPLAPMLAGAAIRLGRALGADDVLSARCAFFAVSCLAAGALYLLGLALFESHRAGLLTAFVFLGFYGFGRHAASGPDAKTPMVLFEVLALLFACRRRWFWSGFCGALAALAWQPAGIYAALALLLALLRAVRGREGYGAPLRAAAGAAVPLAGVCLYFLCKGALYELWDGMLLFNLRHLERGGVTLAGRILNPVKAVASGYPTMLVPIILGFVMIGVLYVWRLGVHRGAPGGLVLDDPFAALLLSFPLPVFWSLVDFQWYPDFFVFLPYVALGFGWLLSLGVSALENERGHGDLLARAAFVLIGIALAGSAGFNYRLRRETGLVSQRSAAEDIRSRWGGDARILSLGRPDALALLGRRNPSRYVFVINGIDNHINACTPGGFAGWLAQVAGWNPDLIVFGATRGRFKRQIEEWLRADYRETDGMTWTLLVKREQGARAADDGGMNPADASPQSAREANGE